MTGFGDGRRESKLLSVGVEIRTLNHRHLKIVVKGLEAYTALEPRIEPIVREQIRRGSVQVTLRIDRVPQVEDYVLNTTALVSYWRQLETLQQQLGNEAAISLGDLLVLRGVVREDALPAADIEQVWPVVEQALREALNKLETMRRREGRRMADELAGYCKAIRSRLDSIQERAPRVVEEYAARLHERVSALLARVDVQLDADELIKELSIYAERSDISEELVRHRSHLDQFEATLDEPSSEGRKLEFLSQEMVRETNTIGSKANDVHIAREVVEIKGTIDRIRELVQNVE
jgi:uncharacterized protein (TIGR00255 family)